MLSIPMTWRNPRNYNWWQRLHAYFYNLRNGTKLHANLAVACPECFRDQGLRLLSSKVAFHLEGACPNCKTINSKKIRARELEWIAHTFFVWGTFVRADYGGYPAIQFNDRQKTSVTFSDELSSDARFIEKMLGIGFFLYGPRFWMFGEIEPLKALQRASDQTAIIQRIIAEYPKRVVDPQTQLYRVRKTVEDPAKPHEYDSPPLGMEGTGRLDSKGFPVLYASSDLEICVHECRISAEDSAYVATLKPTRALNFLDLSQVLEEKNVTEFESLDLSVHMLFLAGAHSYEISRKISVAAKKAGFDGIVYPSYFSLLQKGAMPFATTFGISHRTILQYREVENWKMIPNVAIFGRPIEDGTLEVICLNRLMINGVAYNFHFGPVIFS